MMELTVDTVRLAIEGIQKLLEPELIVTSGDITDEQQKAIEAVHDNLVGFRKLIRKELAKYPLINQYFDPHIRRRLHQDVPEASPLVQLLFNPLPSRPSTLERRLERTHHIPNFDEIFNEHRPTRGRNSGELNDERARDALAEIMAIDALLHLGFKDLRKLSRTVDFTGKYCGRPYWIEVTRVRERIFRDTLQFGSLEDCNGEQNQRIIRNALIGKLVDKRDQFPEKKQAKWGTSQYYNLLIIKTSDYGFVECTDTVGRIAQELLREEQFHSIDRLLLIPTVDFGQVRTVSKSDVLVGRFG